MGLKIRETVTIDGPVSDIWAFVSDPVLESVWNPKLVALERDRDGPVSIGERYTVTYRMSGRDRVASAEVIESVPHRSVRVAYTLGGEDAGRGTSSVEYALEDVGGGIRVTQTIDLAEIVPWFLVPLIWFVTTFGRPKDTPYLENLKHAVEELGGKENAPVV